MIVPAPGYLLAEVVETDDTTPAGVYSHSENATVSYAKVISLGKPAIEEGGVVLDAPQFNIDAMNIRLAPGDIILYHKHTGVMINEYSDPVQVIIKFNAIIALKGNNGSNT